MVKADFESLHNWKVPSEPKVVTEDGEFDMFSLCLGGAPPPKLLALRKVLKLPGGPPTAGGGFFDSTAVPDGTEHCETLTKMTAEQVKKVKLAQLTAQAENKDSVYFYGIQPIFDPEDNVCYGEILLRAKNGTDTAPYEDINELVKPEAAEDVKACYLKWKVCELIDWPLAFLKSLPKLQQLRGIMVNIRPLDLDPAGSLYMTVKGQLEALSADDKALFLSKVSIEVTEDQQHPPNMQEAFRAWTGLGFQLSYDDGVGDIACEALSKKGSNFHTISNLEKELDHFAHVKVDIEWAGFLIFLCHPMYNFRKELKEEVLQSAQVNDEVLKPMGPTNKVVAKHSAILEEFAVWPLKMITAEKKIVVECTVRQDDPNCAFALGKLKELGLDIFGQHKDHFFFQGGLTGAKAFPPDILAKSIL